MMAERGLPRRPRWPIRAGRGDAGAAGRARRTAPVLAPREAASRSTRPSPRSRSTSSTAEAEPALRADRRGRRTSLGELWLDPWFLARIQLSVYGIAVLSAVAARAPEAQHEELAAAGARLLADGRTSAEKGLPLGRALGREGLAWRARLEAEGARLRWLDRPGRSGGRRAGRGVAARGRRLQLRQRRPDRPVPGPTGRGAAGSGPGRRGRRAGRTRPHRGPGDGRHADAGGDPQPRRRPPVRRGGALRAAGRSPTGSATCWPSWSRGGRTGRSPAASTSARRRSASTSRTSWPSWASVAAPRLPPWLGEPDRRSGHRRSRHTVEWGLQLERSG